MLPQPLCMVLVQPMEIAIGRKTREGAPGAFRTINKKSEFVGWAATTNAFAISTYYAVVFAWVIAMAVFSFKFAGMVGDSQAASSLFANITNTSFYSLRQRQSYPLWSDAQFHLQMLRFFYLQDLRVRRALSLWWQLPGWGFLPERREAF